MSDDAHCELCEMLYVLARCHVTFSTACTMPLKSSTHLAQKAKHSYRDESKKLLGACKRGLNA